MTLQEQFQRLRLPMICAPLFIISNPDLVIEQCKAGVIGSFPALNAREAKGEPIMLDAWLQRITEELDRHNQANPDRPAAPFAVNQIVHRSNPRLERDVELCIKWKVPIWITSLGARVDVNEAAHANGAVTLHDVISNRYARKAIEKGADGLIAVCAGAGGHTGSISPFALIQEIRAWYEGPLALSGAVARGESILAAQVLGADVAYVGSPFIATPEANAKDAYKKMIVDCSSADVAYTNCITGVWGNYLKPSMANVGLDPDNLPVSDPSAMDFTTGETRPKAWADVWGSGQGIGAVSEIVPVSARVEQFALEYQAALSAVSQGQLPLRSERPAGVGNWGRA